MSSLTEIWRDLEITPDTKGLYVQRQLVVDAALDLYLAVDNETACRMLIISFDATKVIFKNKFKNTTGLEIKILAGREYGVTKKICRIRLLDSKFKGLFSVLIQDLAQQLDNVHDEQTAFNILIGRITEWQAFFDQQKPDGLTKEQQRGLYGELKFLELLIHSLVVESSGLSCWQGPYGADQDFQFSNCQVEVKVSLSGQNQEMLIANERQLNRLDNSRLFIRHSALSLRPAAGETLPELISKIRSKIPSQFAFDFNNLLFKAGYLDAHAETYESTGGYQLRELNYFEVTDNFPALTEQNLPLGVGRVSYALSVPECKHFAVSEDLILEVLKFVHV